MSRREAAKRGSRLGSRLGFLPKTGLFQIGRSQCTYRTESSDRINTSVEAEAETIAIVSIRGDCLNSVVTGSFVSQCASGFSHNFFLFYQLVNQVHVQH